MEPIILDNVFNEKIHSFIMKELSLTPNNDIYWEESRSRTISTYHTYSKFSNLLLPIARKTFKNNEILPSYTAWARYLGFGGALEKHRDLNACTFTIDYCVNYFEPWPIIIEGNEYILKKNQAICFMGEEQEHWRPKWKPGNVVDMIFFHYVEPHHWWYTGDGGNYLVEN